MASIPIDSQTLLVIDEQGLRDGPRGAQSHLGLQYSLAMVI